MTAPAPTPSARRTVASSALTTIPTFYRLLLRGQLSRGRTFVLAVLGAIALLTAGLTRLVEGRERAAGRSGEFVESAEVAATFALGDYGLGLFLPLVALMLGHPMLGNLVEDRLLVYLWLKPTPRWHLAVAAVGAVFTVVLAVTGVSLLLATLLAGQLAFAGPILLAVVLGSMAYAAVFVFIGVRFSWGLWLGLAYLAVWENVFARLGDGPARASLRSYLLSIFEWGTVIELPLADRSVPAAIIVPLVVAAVATWLTARALQRRDID